MRIKQKLSCLAIILATAIIAYYIFAAQNKEADKEIQQLVKEERARCLDTQKRLEQTLRSIYQNLRAISLMPSIRTIEGGNLPKDSKSAVETGLFNMAQYNTIQQAYVKLATDSAVSEIYCVIDGFKPKDKETPFLTFDELVVKGHSGLNDADQPEEDKSAEYAWFALGLSEIKNQYPIFKFQKIDEIPAFASPILRTCDNTQYTSKSKGDERDALGIIIAVPFYNTQKAFKGVIAAVIRINVLEAALLNIPFLPVLNEDFAKAKSEGWALPQDPERFMLINNTAEIHIYDRRAKGLLELAKKAKPSGPKATGRQEYFLDSLKLNFFKGQWQLFYALDAKKIKNINDKSRSNMAAKNAVVIVIGIFLVFWIIQQQKRAEYILKIISRLQETNVKLQDSSNQLLRTSQSLSEETANQAASIEETSSSLTQINSSTKNNAMSSEAANKLAHEAFGSAEESNKAMGEMKSAIGAINDSSNKITKIIKTIEEIALQTNLLALNAAVEAARAGEHGKEFAVVAQEVRNLAQRCAGAAKETKELIVDSINKAKGGVKIATASDAVIGNIMTNSKKVASIINEITIASQSEAESIGQISKAINNIGETTQRNAATAEETAAASKELKSQADTLLGMIEELQKLMSKS